MSAGLDHRLAAMHDRFLREKAPENKTLAIKKIRETAQLLELPVVNKNLCQKFLEEAQGLINLASKYTSCSEEQRLLNIYQQNLELITPHYFKASQDTLLRRARAYFQKKTKVTLFLLDRLPEGLITKISNFLFFEDSLSLRSSACLFRDALKSRELPESFWFCGVILRCAEINPRLTFGLLFSAAHDCILDKDGTKAEQTPHPYALYNRVRLADIAPIRPSYMPPPLRLSSPAGEPRTSVAFTSGTSVGSAVVFGTTQSTWHPHS